MSQTEAKLFIKTPPEPVRLKKTTLETRSKRVWAFLEKHPGVHIQKMATAVEYDGSNFRKYMKAKKRLPQALLLKVEKYLKDYGLNVY